MPEEEEEEEEEEKKKKTYLLNLANTSLMHAISVKFVI
jgi:hypothetical protein